MLITEETAGKVGGGLKVEAWLQELEENEKTEQGRELISILIRVCALCGK